MDFPEIYDLHFAKVYNYVRYRVGTRDATDDVVSRIFEHVLGKLHTYDPRRGSLEAWLYAVARNDVAAHFRRRWLRSFIPLESVQEVSSDRADVAASLAKTESLGALLAAVSRLDERRRDLIAMKFGLGLTNREIARIMGLSESNVGTLLNRAVTRLRLELSERGTPHE